MTANEQISEAVAGVENPVWQLELAKYAAQRLPVSDGRFEYLQPQNSRSYIVSVIRLIAGMVVGLALLAVLMLMTLPSLISQRRFLYLLQRHSSDRTFIALHGEKSNRTGHLLWPHFEAGCDPVYIVLGRFVRSNKQIGRLFDSSCRYPRKTVLRPLSFRSCMKTLSSLPVLMRDGEKALRQTPIRPSLRALCAICFRFILGVTHGHFWSQTGLSPSLVLFGHTGAADTTQLELAMQSCGAQTVHVAHGVSHGWNFAALSDLGLFNSAHDARLAVCFTGYKKTASLSTRHPTLPASPSNALATWLVLTSYSHPMNPAYIQNGVSADLAMIKQIEALAARSENRPSFILWRPHPAIEKLPNADQQALRQAAHDAGFQPWPANQKYEAIATYDTVFTTPSTAAMDVLRCGINPVLIVAEPLEKDSVYAKMTTLYPDRPADLQRLKSNKEFLRIWAEVMPAARLTHIDQIKNVLPESRHFCSKVHADLSIPKQ